MNAKGTLRGMGADLLTAIQFLTRIPVSAPYAPDALPRAAKFFPLVGLMVGACAAGLNMLIAPHLPRLVTATLLVVFLVLITGCLHEDGLADAADALGGGWTREQILIILKDSRIGSYGAAALTLSLVARVVLLASLQANQIAWYLIVSQLLCRWSTLPLSAFLPSARPAVDGGTPGQGARIARLLSPNTLVFGSLFSFAVAAIALKMHAIVVIGGAMLLTLLSGVYYKRRTGGVTGDFFGATNQLMDPMNELHFVRHATTEMAGTFCGHLDPPVSAAGHQQIAELVERLGKDRYDAVYTSDLRRAQTTAGALAAFFSIPCVARPALREIYFGLWEGLTWNEIQTRDPAYATRWMEAYPMIAAPCGEAFSDFERRVSTETDWLLNQKEHRHILVVSHAGVLRSILQSRCMRNEQEAWALTREYCCSFRYAPAVENASVVGR